MVQIWRKLYTVAEWSSYDKQQIT